MTVGKEKKAVAFFSFPTVIILLFSAFISTSYFFDVMSKSEVSHRRSSSLLHVRLMSSGKCRSILLFVPDLFYFIVCPPPVSTPPLNESKESIIICLRKILKSVGDNTYPCFTPTVALNHALYLSPINTVLYA